MSTLAPTRVPNSPKTARRMTHPPGATATLVRFAANPTAAETRAAEREAARAARRARPTKQSRSGARVAGVSMIALFWTALVLVVAVPGATVYVLFVSGPVVFTVLAVTGSLAVPQRT